jgi:hypothetical protein
MTCYRSRVNHETEGIDSGLMQAYDQRHNKTSRPGMVDEPTKDCGVTDASWAAATLSGCKRAPATLLEWLAAFYRSFRSAQYEFVDAFLPISPATASIWQDRWKLCAPFTGDLSEVLCDIQGAIRASLQLICADSGKVTRNWDP